MTAATPRIVMCPDDRIQEHQIGVDAVLDAMGHSYALVTDSSELSDFDPEPEQIQALEALVGRAVSPHALIWELGRTAALRLKPSEA